MERMCERVEGSEYYQMQHFISESPWDHRGLIDQVAGDVSDLLNDSGLVGLLIDESSIEKKLFENEMPFLSAYDLREVIMQTYTSKGKSYAEIVAQIKKGTGNEKLTSNGIM